MTGLSMQQLSFHYDAQALAMFGSLHRFLLLCQLWQQGWHHSGDRRPVVAERARRMVRTR